MERLFIQRAYDFIKTEEAAVPITHDPGKALLRASKGTYRFDVPDAANADHVNAVFTWTNQQYEGLLPLHHAHIMRPLLLTAFFEEHANPAPSGAITQSLSIPFFTESERNDFVYRAHPNYRGEGAYYDWVSIRWETGTDLITEAPIFQNYIGRILGFIMHPGNHDTYAIVHSTMDDPNPTVDHRHGVLGRYWHLEFEGTQQLHQPLLQLAPVASLLEHCCMIPYTDTDEFMWVHIFHPSSWPACFQTILPPGQEGNIVQPL